MLTPEILDQAVDAEFDLAIAGLFEGGEVVATLEEEFGSALDRAVLGDVEAFSVMSASMDFLQSSGEIQRLQQMTMQLGAMACMHDHLQEFSQQTTSRFNEVLSSHADDDGHNHSADKHNENEDDDEEQDPEYEFAWVDGKFIRRKKIRGK